MKQEHKVAIVGQRYYDVLLPQRYTEINLIALHGYGQTKQQMGAVLEPLLQHGIALWIAEGPHRFYRRSNGGEIVSSWMTSFHRKDDIAANHQYLTAIADECRKQNKAPIAVLGFSQGCPTAMRWAVEDNQIELVILYAGDAGLGDISPQAATQAQKRLKVSLLVGKDDSVVAPERLQEEDKKLKELGFQTTCTVVEGAHAIQVDEVLNLIKGELRSKE